MHTNSKFINLLLIIVIIFVGAKCDNDTDNVMGVPITDYYDSCMFEDYSFGQMFTIGDPNDKFMITLPYDWDLRENYSDSVYGMQTGNFLSIPVDIKDRMFFMISGYSTELSLEDYYLNELKSFKNESNIELQETGKTLIDGVEAYWLKFSAGEKVFHLVMYVKHPELDDVYLLQASAYDEEKHDLKLCYMKQFFNSFELAQNN